MDLKDMIMDSLQPGVYYKNLSSYSLQDVPRGKYFLRVEHLPTGHRFDLGIQISINDLMQFQFTLGVCFGQLIEFGKLKDRDITEFRFILSRDKIK